MPVYCPSDIPRLTSQQFGSLDYRVMPAAFAIHNEIGCHWDERVYHEGMHEKLLSIFPNALSEVPLTVTFGNYSKTYRLDLVVDELGIYELKTVDSINKAHVGQVLNYLRLLNATRAKIINFRNHVVESKFVNCSDTLVQRRIFEVDGSRYRGPSALNDTLIEMLRDLGTRLSIRCTRHVLSPTSVGQKPRKFGRIEMFFKRLIWSTMTKRLSSPQWRQEQVIIELI